MVDIEKALLAALGERGSLPDSSEFAKQLGADHLDVVGVIKSLESYEMITVKVREIDFTLQPLVLWRKSSQRGNTVFCHPGVESTCEDEYAPEIKLMTRG